MDEKGASTMIPRSYQIEIFEQAQRENVIACLGTGTGKTFIAILLIKSRTALLRDPDRKRILIFLVPTVPLASQQRHTIAENTDLKVKAIVGRGIDSYDQSAWDDEIRNHEILVMTPQILLNSLHHTFMSLEMIDTLIFDECHHAHKDHPYALIMKDFYTRVEVSKRPKIFGMTASPVDSKGLKSREHCAQRLHSLEAIMDSKLVTVHDMADVEAVLPSASEEICVYDPPCQLASILHVVSGLEAIYNSLTSELTSSDHPVSLRKRMSKRVSSVWLSIDYCARELGLYCAFKAAEKLLTSQTMDEHEEDLQVRELLLQSRRRFLLPAVELLRIQLHQEDLPMPGSASALVGILSQAVSHGLLSPKVQTLVLELSSRRLSAQPGTPFHCIVFVERVITAHVVSGLLTELLPSWIQIGVLTGSQGKMGGRAMTNRQQADVLDLFRTGQLSVLISTDVAEEGLDIQQCNAVLRFDMSKSVRSYIQSKGRARARHSAYVIFVERDSAAHSSLLSLLQTSEVYMREETLSRTQIPLPLVASMPEPESYTVDSTGATVDIHYSISLLHHYCSQLPGDRYCELKPAFEEVEAAEGFVSQVCLPCNAPAEAAFFSGPVRPNKTWARQAACLGLLRLLHLHGHLSDHLLPHKVKEATTPDTTPAEGKKKHSKIAISDTVPLALRASKDPPGNGCPERQLFAYAITVDIPSDPAVQPDGWKQGDVAPMALLTAKQLDPETCSMQVDLLLAHGVTATAHLAAGGSLLLTQSQVDLAKRFHSQVVYDALWRCHTCAPPGQDGPTDAWDTDRFYIVLPLEPNSPFAIDWGLVDLAPLSSRQGEAMAGHSQALTLGNGWFLMEEIMGKVVETPHNGCRYFVQGLSEKNGQSKFPDPQYDTFEDYFLGSHGCSLSHRDQPLLVVRMIPRPQNFLRKKDNSRAVRGAVKRGRALALLPPELCLVLYPGPVLRAVQVLPSVLHRLEGMELAAQLRNRLAEEIDDSRLRNVRASKVLEGLTCARAQQSFSLERLELIGDTCLKYVISRHFFQEFPSHHEGLLSSRRVLWTSNACLARLADSKGIKDYVRAFPLEVDHFLAPGVPRHVSQCTHRGNGGAPRHRKQKGDSAMGSSSSSSSVQASREAMEWEQKGSDSGDMAPPSRTISSKSIADVMEALIAVYWEELEGCMGLEGAVKVMQWMGLPVGPLPDSGLSESVEEGPLPAFVAEVERRVGYTFRKKSLLVEALTHASYLEAAHLTRVPCYQRLEFLGDAVLDLLLTRQLAHSHPQLGPGILSELRSASVNNETFALAAVKPSVELHRFLRHGSPDLAAHIRKFLDTSSEHILYRHNFGDKEEAAPKVLGDLLEAMAGAILVDSGFDTGAVWRVIQPLLGPLVSPSTLRRHPVTVLVELFQSRGFGMPRFRMTAVPMEGQGEVPSPRPRSETEMWKVELVLEEAVLGEVCHRQRQTAKKMLAASVYGKVLRGEMMAPGKRKGVEPIPEGIKLNDCAGGGSMCSVDQQQLLPLHSPTETLDHTAADSLLSLRQKGSSQLVEDLQRRIASLSLREDSSHSVSSLGNSVQNGAEALGAAVASAMDVGPMAAGSAEGVDHLHATSPSKDGLLQVVRGPLRAEGGVDSDRQSRSEGVVLSDVTAQVNSVVMFLQSQQATVGSRRGSCCKNGPSCQSSAQDRSQSVTSLDVLCCRRKWELNFTPRTYVEVGHQLRFVTEAVVAMHPNDVAQRIVISGEGCGVSKREAKGNAAISLLNKLQEYI